MNAENLQQYEKQLEIAEILIKNEKDITEEEMKKVNDFFYALEEQNKNSKPYTLEEFENIIDELLEELKYEEIQARNRRNSLAINKTSY